MPRTKKSRKPGQIGSPKQTTQRSQADTKKKKISKGRASGSRNSMLEQNSLEPKQFVASKDRRHGSKKKINLLAENRQDKQQQKSALPKFKSPQEELDFIENDKKLQSLLDKVDQGYAVDKEEQNYIDTLLNRHGLLCDLLGIDSSDQQVDEQEEDTEQVTQSSEDLLDQLDRDFKF